MLHVLFDISTISEESVIAASDFVNLSLSNLAYLSGRGNFEDFIESLRKGNIFAI